MKEIEIIVEKGGDEKKIVISSGIISFNQSENSVNQKFNTSTIVLAGNGDFPPPFTKGSKVLREIRETSNNDIQIWKLILPLEQNDDDFFRFPINLEHSNGEFINRKNWGIWLHESSKENFPDIILVNFPLWTLSKNFKNEDFTLEQFEEVLSFFYRTIMSGLSAYSTFLSNKKIENSDVIAFSDIGNNLIDKNLIANLSSIQFQNNDIFKKRIRIFTQVLSDWLLKNDFFNKAVIAYGEGIRTDLVERAWDDQVEESKSDITEFGEALLLRDKNSDVLKKLIQSTKNSRLRTIYEMSFDTFSAPTPSLSADLIQCRSLVEAISYELCTKFELKSQNGNLYGYLERLEQSKKVSPWVTSYFHVIRQLGNEAAHYKNEVTRRPEKPVGKDLIVIHAALNRILSFCRDEQL